MTVKCRIKKDDEVIVLTGKDKGKKGKVMQVLPKEQRVVVAKVNVVKRHTRPSAVSAGGIVEKEASIHISNVALVDPKDGAATRVGYKVSSDGGKVRVAKRSGSEIA
jgi:large subunit ribosomal protein L24